jgi:hypothetical protein
MPAIAAWAWAAAVDVRWKADGFCPTRRPAGGSACFARSCSQLPDPYEWAASPRSGVSRSRSDRTLGSDFDAPTASRTLARRGRPAIASRAAGNFSTHQGRFARLLVADVAEVPAVCLRAARAGRPACRGFITLALRLGPLVAARWRPRLPQPAMTPSTPALAGAIVRGPASTRVPSQQAAAVPVMLPFGIPRAGVALMPGAITWRYSAPGFWRACGSARRLLVSVWFAAQRLGGRHLRQGFAGQAGLRASISMRLITPAYDVPRARTQPER